MRAEWRVTDDPLKATSLLPQEAEAAIKTLVTSGKLHRVEPHHTGVGLALRVWNKGDIFISKSRVWAVQVKHQAKKRRPTDEAE